MNATTSIPAAPADTLTARARAALEEARAQADAAEAAAQAEQERRDEQTRITRARLAAVEARAELGVEILWTGIADPDPDGGLLAEAVVDGWQLLYRDDGFVVQVACGDPDHDEDDGPYGLVVCDGRDNPAYPVSPLVCLGLALERAQWVQDGGCQPCRDRRRRQELHAAVSQVEMRP